MGPLSFPLIAGFSAAASLSLSTDGHISSAQWAEAHAWDRAHPLTVETPAIARVEIRKSYGIRLLAFHFRQALIARGLIEERDVANLGLTQKQIADWKPEALALVLSSNPRLAEAAFAEAA